MLINVQMPTIMFQNLIDGGLFFRQKSAKDDQIIQNNDSLPQTHTALHKIGKQSQMDKHCQR